MSRKYANPPLVESLCEFRFVPGTPWSITLYGDIHSKIKDEFPVVAQVPVAQFNMGVHPTGGAQAGARVEQRTNFRRHDGTAVVQIFPDVLTINQLRPYPGWPDFRRLITRVLDAYKQSAKPSGLSSVTLRYINRIPVAEPSREEPTTIQDYVLAFPNLPEAVPQTFYEWGQRVVIPLSSNVLILQSTALQEENGMGFALDLQITPAGETIGEVTFDTIVAWLDEAHSQLEEVFELCIGDEARKNFG